MSFKNEILSSIRTPKEVKNDEIKYIIYECKKSAEDTYEKIKYLLKNAAFNGKYEMFDGHKIIKVEPCIVESGYDAKGFNEYIENRLFISTIDISYKSNWKLNFLGQVKKTIFTYNIQIVDEFKYQAFMRELYNLATADGILISLKMKFNKFHDTLSQYENFPGTLNGYIDGMDDEFDHPERWVKIFMIAEMKL